MILTCMRLHLFLEFYNLGLGTNLDPANNETDAFMGYWAIAALKVGVFIDFFYAAHVCRKQRRYLLSCTLRGLVHKNVEKGKVILSPI